MGVEVKYPYSISPTFPAHFPPQRRNFEGRHMLIVYAPSPIPRGNDVHERGGEGIFHHRSLLEIKPRNTMPLNGERGEEAIR